VFISCAIYLAFPPFLKISIIKVVISTLIFLSFGILAIRIKGKIVVVWLSLVMSYRNRPRYYVFNKNDIVNREIVKEKVEVEVQEAKAEDTQSEPLLNLAIHDLARLEAAIADPLSNLNFKNKKGILSVHITEIQ
jgi:hypothetical protein